MWIISLGMLAIAINYVLSSSLEVFYDIPALAIALLFALPFVRDVQPSVPTVGITVDILGFFFNMIIIAIATLMVMGALSSRHHRAQRKLAGSRETRLVQRAQLSMEEGSHAGAQLNENFTIKAVQIPSSETAQSLHGSYSANQVVPDVLPSQAQTHIMSPSVAVDLQHASEAKPIDAVNPKTNPNADDNLSPNDTPLTADDTKAD
eukprot:365303-Chlamydomonas_euryale.AAC.53